MKIPEIETERLLLRAFKEDDLDTYAKMCADKLYRQYLGIGNTLSREEAWKSMSSMLGHWYLKGYGVWALENKANNELIGHAGIINPEGWPGVEVCWGLSPNHWKNGFATEAAEVAKNWAFSHLKMKTLISVIYPENIASINVSKRIGQRFKNTIQLHNKTVNIYEISQ